MTAVLETYLLCNHASRKNRYGKALQAEYLNLTQAEFVKQAQKIEFVQDIRKREACISVCGMSGETVTSTGDRSQSSIFSCPDHAGDAKIYRIVDIGSMKASAMLCDHCGYRVMISEGGRPVKVLPVCYQFNNKDGKLLYSGKLIQASRLVLMYIDADWKIVVVQITDF